MVSQKTGIFHRKRPNTQTPTRSMHNLLDVSEMPPSNAQTNRQLKPNFFGGSDVNYTWSMPPDPCHQIIWISLCNMNACFTTNWCCTSNEIIANVFFGKNLWFNWLTWHKNHRFVEMIFYPLFALYQLRRNISQIRNERVIIWTISHNWIKFNVKL